jgi:hypothetical protein
MQRRLESLDTAERGRVEDAAAILRKARATPTATVIGRAEVRHHND